MTENPITVLSKCLEAMAEGNYAGALPFISSELLEDYRFNGSINGGIKVDKKSEKDKTHYLSILEDRKPLENMVNFQYHHEIKQGNLRLMTIQEIDKDGLINTTRTIAFVVENAEYKIRYFDLEKERRFTRQRLPEAQK